MARVLMVCIDNICWSTMAHQVLVKATEVADLNAQIHVDSAGGSDGERGNPTDRRAVWVLRENGHDVPDHCTHQAGLYELGERDLILAMTRRHLAALNCLRDWAGLHGQDRSGLRLFCGFDPQVRPGDMDLPDPWRGDYSDSVETLEAVERTTSVVLEYLRGL